MNDLRKATELGTKAWADVPDATEWVDDLRGNDKLPVKSYCGGKPNYCTPVDGVYTKLDTTAGVLHKEWVGLSEDEFEKILETHNEAMPFAVYLSIEAKLKEKNT